MRRAETVVTADDGTRLLARLFRPRAERAGRTLVIVHGASEHGGRYEHVAAKFVAHRWDVIAADLRGHGRSGGPPVHVDRFCRYVADLQSVLRHFSLPAERTALLGHSLGGLVAIRFAQLQTREVSAVVLTSPLLGINVPIPRATLAAGRLLSYLWPRWRFRSRVDPAETTGSPEVLRRRKADPLIHRTVTAGWFFAMRSAIEAAWDEADRLRLPMLVLQAGEDRIVDPEAVEPWLQKVSARDATFRLLPGRLHELLNEPDWQTSTGTILQWLDRRVGTAIGRPREPAA